MPENFFQKFLTSKNIVFSLVFILSIIFIVNNPDVAIMFFASSVIACSLNPTVDKLNIRMKREHAAAIVLSAFIFIILLAFIPIGYICIMQISAFLSSIPKFIDSIDDIIMQIPFLKQSGLVNIDLTSYFANMANHTNEYFDAAVNVAKEISSAIVYIFVTIIFTYFFMADTNSVKISFMRLFPKNMRSKLEEVIDIIARKIGGYIVAEFWSVLSVGVVMTLGLLVFGVKYALILGLITCVLDLIPVVGPAFALIISLITTFDEGSFALLGVLISFCLAQLIENQFVRPFVFSKLFHIHPILVFIFLMIAAKYFGIVGALFAPAVAASVSVIFEELYIKNINK